MFKLVITISLCVVLGVQGQTPFLGKCPEYNVVGNFEASKYLGKWYEYRKSFAIFEAGAKCVVATYTLKDDGSVGVHNAQINILTNKESSIDGYATLADRNVGKLAVTFPSVPATAGAPYWVLGTDYTNYAFVWSCNEFFGVANAQIFWILTRERFPSEETINKALNLADQLGINKTLLSVTDQKNCPANH